MKVLTILWVLECLELCQPTAPLRRTWETKELCRQDVIKEMNSWNEKDRFKWRCIAMQADIQYRGEFKAEDLERK